MIARPAVQYTSLRDIIPQHLPPPPPPIVSPAYNSSWNEIPIKNPLVKQAALAYLQATPTPTDVASKGLFHVLNDRCFCGDRGGSACFDWLNGVVLKAIAEFFVRLCELRRRDDSEDADDEEEIVD
ncbi:uncharacterized protein LOC114753036 [Neltuma alba]|uniref:uncharacterized protein LOC114753036 n=1 Tax=Neltuma alba TaxID=207710 RepID=UPI0010A39713|nr:uncharacterized protein LOC114753036 [Prosopis alba]